MNLLAVVVFLLCLATDSCGANKDVAWDTSDAAHKQCLEYGVQKLACARFQEVVEDVFNEIGVRYSFALNRTEAEILSFMELDYYQFQWNLIVKQFIKWLKTSGTTSPKKMKDQMDRQFSNFMLKLVVSGFQHQNDLSPESRNAMEKIMLGEIPLPHTPPSPQPPTPPSPQPPTPPSPPQKELL